MIAYNNSWSRFASMQIHKRSRRKVLLAPLTEAGIPVAGRRAGCISGETTCCQHHADETCRQYQAVCVTSVGSRQAGPECRVTAIRGKML